MRDIVEGNKELYMGSTLGEAYCPMSRFQAQPNQRSRSAKLREPQLGAPQVGQGYCI